MKGVQSVFWMVFLFIMVGLAPEDSHWRNMWFLLLAVSVALSVSKPSHKALEELEETDERKNAVADLPEEWRV